MARRAHSRRQFAKAALGACGSVLLPRIAKSQVQTGGAHYQVQLQGDWLFGGKFSEGAATRDFNDSGFARITLPHCVSTLSWKDWDPGVWEDIWVYRRHFRLPAEAKTRRVFLQFDGVMTAATPYLNGEALAKHAGGYLPFEYEITEHLAAGDNVLAVAVDSRWQNVPPDGSPRGRISVDYLEAGGVYRPVRLSIVPGVFLRDVFAKAVNVLNNDRRVDVACTIDAAAASAGSPIEIRVELLDGARVLARAQQTVKLEKAGGSEAVLMLANLGNVALWHPDHPQLYSVVATILVNGRPVHDYRVRIGFREARFEVDGFFLNGKRFHFFGLNRHEIYPYVGGAMPARVLRRDAEILRRDFHCNMVRCSHYPQSEAFLDACDGLGLMVWEEPPGWGYIGDDAWKELAVRDVREMILRDRNHPSIVIWGVRVNESRNDVALYARTTELARRLDGTRPASGSMTSTTMRTREDWHEDVFALDDYHAGPDGTVGIHEPLPGVPYMLAETVGQFNYTAGKNFDSKYFRTADVATQTAQALRHAQAHDRARAYPRMCGVIAWCAFDYASQVNNYHNVKTPGVADVFRVPKLGAAFYQSQVSPKVLPVILPGFYWDFGPQNAAGPGKRAAIFSNCERLEVFIGGKRVARVQPDRAGFRHLDYPPFFCDLSSDGAENLELRIDGYVGERVVLSRLFSPDRSKDQFVMTVDNPELLGDGADATRLVFRVVDRYGAPRLNGEGEVRFEISGPGSIVGDNPFRLGESGGVGAVWIRTSAGGRGRIRVTGIHSALGRRSVDVMVVRELG
jgi:beta-galactosidase